MDLFVNALNEKPKPGAPDIYQTISNSIYLKADGTKFRFGTLPGAAALLYYSNSGLMVIFGMMFLSLLVLFSELFILKLTANPILCSLYGALIASNVTQFAGRVRDGSSFYLMLIIGIAAIWVIQSNGWTWFLIKLKLHNERRT